MLSFILTVASFWDLAKMIIVGLTHAKLVSYTAFIRFIIIVHDHTTSILFLHSNIMCVDIL